MIFRDIFVYKFVYSRKMMKI